MSLLSPSLSNAIGWTLVHFVWQGALLTCATAAAMVALRNARPQTRYTVCCTALLLCLAWPACELLTRLGARDAVTANFGVTGRLLMAEHAAESVSLLGWLQLQLAWIVGFWLACAVALTLRMAAGLLWIERLSGTRRSDGPLQARVTALACKLGVTRRVRLKVVEQLASPITAGWWRPVVLVPASLVSGMPPELLEALLAHEMAHIKRLDYLVNLGQNVVEILLFYHPAVWWISGRIRAEREQIADDIAATALGEPRRLAQALSELERLQFSPHHLAQAANGGELMNRIKRLVRPGRNALDWKAALPLLGLAATGLTLYANAQAPVADQPAPAKTSNRQVHRAGDMLQFVKESIAPAPASATPPMPAARLKPILAKAPERAAPMPPAVTPTPVAPAPVEQPAAPEPVAAAEVALAEEAVAPRALATPATPTQARANFNSCAKPLWPKSSLRAEHTGTVTLAFFIGKDGSVLDSKIVTSSGHEELDEASRIGIGKCTFRPATMDREPVAGWMRMQYVWTLAPAKKPVAVPADAQVTQ